MGAFPPERNLAALEFGGYGGHFAAVYHRGDNTIQLRGGQHHHAAFGPDGTAVFHTGKRRAVGGIKGVHILLIHGKGDQIVAVHVQRPSGIAGGQSDLGELSGNHALIAHRRRHQGGQAAFLDADGTLIDDFGIWAARPVKNHLAFHEVGVGNIAGRGDKTVSIHARALVNDHPRRIDKIDIAVGLQTPLNLTCATSAHNAVQTRRL